MGCFFGCFRIKDDHQHRRPNATLVSQSKSAEALISQNRLSALFLAEEKEDSLSKDRKRHVFGSSKPENVDKELNDEARFLKACGTLVETPTEIRKASGRLKSSPSQNGDSEHSKFHSWLPNTSIKKLQLEKEPVEPPTPIKLCEDWQKESSLLEQTPSSCISNGESSIEGSAVGNSDAATNFHSNPVDDSATSVSDPNVRCRNRSVRFECESGAAVFSSGSASSEIASQNSKRSESPSNHSVSKLSPYPTPLKLNDELQTPGTVFPASLGNLENGKNVRIRSQYVYSVLNPVENFSQWSVLKEEGSHSDQFSSYMGESLESLDDATPKAHIGLRETSVAKDLRVEASLSSWLKPSSIQDGNDQNFKVMPAANPHFRKTPVDRPIIGGVAAHWNEEEPARISPKWWDGNGIPNSTNKYKEDQKVSWHATPFEERLEKALSEESMISQRKQINGQPIDFEENEESDTALSQLQPRSNPNCISNAESCTEGSAVGKSDAAINVHSNDLSFSFRFKFSVQELRNASLMQWYFLSGSASSEIASQNSKRSESESPSNHSVFKFSPYCPTTPLKLNDELQNAWSVESLLEDNTSASESNSKQTHCPSSLCYDITIKSKSYKF